MENIDISKVKSQEAYRFLLACNELIIRGMVKSERQISLLLTKENAALLNKIKSGTQDVQKDNIEKLTILYPVNKDFILSNRLPIILEEDEEALKDIKVYKNVNPLDSPIIENPTINELQRKIEKLLEELNSEKDKRIKDKDEVIDLLREIARLNEELRNIGGK